MVGLALAMLGFWSLLARLRGKLFDWDWLHRAAALMGPAGFGAVIAGWVTTEVGRQPFTIYALMRTADSHSPLAAPAVAAPEPDFPVGALIIIPLILAYTSWAYWEFRGKAGGTGYH